MVTVRLIGGLGNRMFQVGRVMPVLLEEWENRKFPANMCGY